MVSVRSMEKNVLGGCQKLAPCFSLPARPHFLEAVSPVEAKRIVATRGPRNDHYPLKEETSWSKILEIP